MRCSTGGSTAMSAGWFSELPEPAGLRSRLSAAAWCRCAVLGNSDWGHPRPQPRSWSGGSRGVVARNRGRGMAVLASVVIAAFGPMTLSEVGTSFADILTALPVIAGLGLILSVERATCGSLCRRRPSDGCRGRIEADQRDVPDRRCHRAVRGRRPLPATGSFVAGGGGGRARDRRCVDLDAVAAVRQSGVSVLQYDFQFSEAPLEPIADMRFMPHGLLDAAGLSVLLADRRSSLVGMGVPGSAFCRGDRSIGE